MRIALVVNQLAPGGAETQLAGLAREFRASRHDVSIVSLLPPTDLAPAPATLALDLRGDLLALPRLAAFFRRVRPEIVHAHLFHSNVATRFLRLVLPFPVLLSTVHSLAESGRDSRQFKARDLVYRLTDPLADATVCVSRAVADRHLAARALSARRLRVIPNGVDTERFRPDPALRQQTRTTLGVGEDFVWLAAGRLIWKKNYPLMLRAAAECRRGVLLIAGAGPEEAALRALADDLRADVRFLGAVADMPALYNAADAFLLSSDVEGLPVALLEAAASGLPAVATDVAGVSDVVRHGETGYVVPPGDVAAFAAAMRDLTSHVAMGRAARDRIVAAFDLRAVAGRWLDLYRELLEQ